MNNKKQFCSSYNNKDYCGFKGQKQVYTKFNCEESDISLADCSKEQHGSMDHQEDVIVKCSMTDYKNLADVQAKDGDVRLMGVGNAESQDGKGRIEIFDQGRFWAVCSQDFTNESAEVACKQMGFESGKLLGGEASNNACKTEA